MTFDPEAFRARLRAAGPPPSFDHLHDTDALWRRLGGDDVAIDDSGEDAEPVEPVKRTRKRKPDFVKQVKRAMAAGLPVRSASVSADSVVMTFGEAPAPVDGTVIETADELRKLI
jgi:hypothetical protein